MKILWITLESILPANSGGRLGVFKRLEQISKQDDIYLFYPYDYEHELKYINELKKYCTEVHAYSRNKNKKHALKNIFKYPYTVSSRHILEMERDINICIENNQIDLINVDFPHMCVNLISTFSNYNLPIVLNEHNIEWQVYKTIAKSQTNLLKKAIYFIDSYRLKKYEEMLFEKLHFRKVTFVSDNDMDYLNKWLNVHYSHLELIPVGADIKKCQSSYSNSLNIIFVGKMSYGPNIEAVKWFVNYVLPKIKDHIEKVKFYIVGKDPDTSILELASETVIVTGTVENLEDYYSIADLVVIPLLNGGGVKVKLLEAIGYNKLIVSTKKGVEGTLFEDNPSMAVADTPDEFAMYCIDILKNSQKYIELQKDIYNIFINNYTWEGIGTKYRNMFLELLKSNI